MALSIDSSKIYDTLPRTLRGSCPVGRDVRLREKGCGYGCVSCCDRVHVHVGCCTHNVGASGTHITCSTLHFVKHSSHPVASILS